MKNMSYAILDGFLTSDPEIKTINGGKKVTNFSIAINHLSKSENPEDVSYLDIETWEKLAENCSEYLKKGSLVTVIGSFRQERWKGADGVSRQKYKVIANSVRFDNYPEKSSNLEEERVKVA